MPKKPTKAERAAALRELLRSHRVFNSHELLLRFGYKTDVAVLFTAGMGGLASVANPKGARVFSPRFKTDPDAHWTHNGCKFFPGKKTMTVPAAKEWASKEYGIAEWTENPLSKDEWVPKSVIDKVEEWARSIEVIPVVDFEPRFVSKDMLAGLANMWHLSATVTSDRHKRAVWTAKSFCKDTGLEETAVYKDLTAMLSWNSK